MRTKCWGYGTRSLDTGIFFIKVINAYDFISCSIRCYPYLKYSKFKLLSYLEVILATNWNDDAYFDSEVKGGVWDHIGQSIRGLESSQG